MKALYYRLLLWIAGRITVMRYSRRKSLFVDRLLERAKMNGQSFLEDQTET